MGETRHRFLMALVATASCSAAAANPVFGRQPKDNPFPAPPPSSETQNPVEAGAANPDA
jgi:hypothetical protein